MRVTGASLAAPVELALKPSSTTTALAIADLTSQVAGNEALRSAGISVSGSAGAPLVFTESLGEAFAVQAMGVTKELGLDLARVNVNGGAVAIGHPIGASGARVLVTLLHEMQRRDVKKGVAALCLGGGNSVALAVER